MMFLELSEHILETWRSPFSGVLDAPDPKLAVCHVFQVNKIILAVWIEQGKHEEYKQLTDTAHKVFRSQLSFPVDISTLCSSPFYNGCCFTYVICHYSK